MNSLEIETKNQRSNFLKNFKIAEKAKSNGDNFRALKHYIKAAEGGIIPAMEACGDLYFRGEGGVEQNTEKAIEWFKKAADLGSSSAMNNIGYIFGTLENYEEAVTWYKKSAELKNVTAMLNLSSVYRDEFQNKKIALQWLKKAESLQDSYSIREVAGFYASEDKNKQAIDFYKKAIALGDINAQRELGDLYFNIEDFKGAEDCYKKAAKSGDIDAMINLGMMLSCIPDCLEEAQYWLRKAATTGKPEALRMLGTFYEENSEYHKALRAYRKAAYAGENVQEDLRNVKKMIKKYPFDYKIKALNI